MQVFPIKRTPIKDPHKRVIVRRLELQVKRGENLDHQYIWGGGRNCGYNPCALIRNSDGDCSWWQGHMINIAGFKLPFPASELSTWSLAKLPELDPKHFAEGHGEDFTIYIKNNGEDAHTISELRGRFNECGGTDNPHPDGRPSWFHPGEGMGLTLNERLREFPIRIHIKGL